MTDPSASRGAGDFALETFIPFQLSVLSNIIGEGISHAYRKQYGLSVTEWRVLAIVGRFPGLTASEVMTRGAMDKVAVSRAVKKLLDRGLMERSAHSEDRRRMPLTLTRGKGRTLFRAVVPRAIAYEQALLEALTEEERAAFAHTLGKLLGEAKRLTDRAAEEDREG